MKARDARRQSDLRQISTAMELYRTQKDNYPTIPTGAVGGPLLCGDPGLIALAVDGDVCGKVVIGNLPVTLADSDGNNYIQRVPTDPNYTGVTADQTNYQYNTDTVNIANNTHGEVSYCISAVLEVPQNGSGFFMCLNGSCFLSTAAC